MPYLSLALPVFNGQRYLTQAVDSILAQTLDDFELIICDNASTDATAQISRDYAARDPRVRYHRNARNLGVAGNFNLGFTLARGEYFRWAAYDDLLAPQYLERCVACLEADSSLAVCHSLSGRIDADGNDLGMYNTELELDAPDAPRRFYSMLWAGAFPPIWGVMRSRMVRRTRMFGDFIGSDRNFLADLLLYGGLKYVRECLFYIRVHPGAYLALGQRSHAFRRWWYGAGNRYPSYMQMPVTAGGYARALLRARMPAREKLACWRHLAQWTGLGIKQLLQRRLSAAGRAA
jgi:glycosyltransferase involved in cell wall biosynthesis